MSVLKMWELFYIVQEKCVLFNLLCVLIILLSFFFFFFFSKHWLLFCDRFVFILRVNGNLTELTWAVHKGQCDPACPL